MKNSLLILVGVLLCFNLSALEVGDEAPCVVLGQMTLDEEINSECILDVSSDEQEYTLIDFFSIYCRACHAALPDLNTLATELGNRMQVKIVDIDRDINEVKKYVSEQRELINFPVAFDNKREATRLYGIKATPTTFIIDNNGTIVYKHVGTFSQEEMDTIRELVK